MIITFFKRLTLITVVLVLNYEFLKIRDIFYEDEGFKNNILRPNNILKCINIVLLMNLTIYSKSTL